MHKIRKDALIVVAYGGGARLFRNVGENNALKFTLDKVIETIEMKGPSGSTAKEISTTQLDEATSAKQSANWINDQAMKNAYSHVVLIADPPLTRSPEVAQGIRTATDCRDRQDVNQRNDRVFRARAEERVNKRAILGAVSIDQLMQTTLSGNRSA